MYLTVKNQLRHLSAREFETLRTLCRMSKNLYNEALYSVRQYYFSERQYLRYERNYHVCKESENYKALGTEIAQQTLKVVDRCFKSFFALINKAKSGFYQFNMVCMPRYLDKEGWFSRLYNKENARLQSIKDKQHIKDFTRRQYHNLRKRNTRINHVMSTASRRIISYCIEHHIGNLVVGYNPDWKQSINLGTHTNQNFVQIPHGILRGKLNYLCKLYGIRYVEQEESYTSKASFFDDDPLPVYNADNPQNYTFSGRRISILSVCDA